jgi:hypothetical protein
MFLTRSASTYFHSMPSRRIRRVSSALRIVAGVSPGGRPVFAFCGLTFFCDLAFICDFGFSGVACNGAGSASFCGMVPSAAIICRIVKLRGGCRCQYGVLEGGRFALSSVRPIQVFETGADSDLCLRRFTWYHRSAGIYIPSLAFPFLGANSTTSRLVGLVAFP